MLPDLNPLDHGEINYLCIEKCSEKMHSAQVYTVEEKFDESKISKLCFKTCMGILWEMREKGEFSQFDTIKIIVDGPKQEEKYYYA